MTEDENRFNYDAIAETYSGHIDQAPFNALYERPAMFGAMPDVAGMKILDAGCGSGWYAEQLLNRGANVDGLDASVAMIEYARKRLAKLNDQIPGRLSLQHADLSEPLAFEDARFDGIVSPLVMHYIADWRPTLREFRRVLKPNAWLLFSTHHPAAEMIRFEPADYFKVEHIVDTWDWLGKVEFYRRPLTEISASLYDSGFVVERLIEPVPTKEFQDADPDRYQALMRRPEFLIILARPSFSSS